MKSWKLCFAFTLAALVASAIHAQESPAEPNHVILKYLGAAGWEITDGTTTILIDPYLSRINGPAPPGGGSGHPIAGDTRRAYKWTDIATPDIAAVIGTESTENVMRAYGVPEEQLITVRGGEDYQFQRFSLKIVPSIHSPLDHKHYFSSATAPPGMKAPLTLEQIHPEGGTLAFLIRFPEHQILAFGGMNYIEREIAGLEPDVVLVGAAASRKEIYDYSGRLMRDLHYPALVLPTHWDNFLLPYEASQEPALEALRSFLQEIAVASPKTKVIVPKYFQPIPLGK